MKTDRFLSLNILLLLSVILLFSCKKEEVSPLQPINNDLDFPVLYIEKGSDIVIDKDWQVDSVILFIDEGVTFRFKNGAGIIIGENWPSAILALGTEENPINFIPFTNGNQPDDYWGGITLNGNFNMISTIENCNFIKGCDDEKYAALNVEYGYISIKNCLFDYSKKYGVLLQSNTRLIEFENNIIKHTYDHPLVIPPLNVHKIGDNNIFIPDLSNKGICLASYSYKDEDLSIVSADDDTIVWKAQTVPYIVKNGLLFKGGKVKICEGTIIAMDNSNGYGSGKIEIKCSLFEVAGTTEKPVIFTSNELNKQPGDWNYIEIEKDAVFKNCIFEYGGHYDSYYNGDCMISLGFDSFATFDSCVFRHSQSDAILVHEYNDDYALFSFSNNIFTDLESYAISLHPESISSFGSNNIFNDYFINVLGDNINRNYIYWKNPGGVFYVDHLIGFEKDYSKIEFEPGVVIKFNGGGFIIGTNTVNTFICKGTEQKPIIFTSAKDNPERGDWKGISFGQNSTSDCILDHCQVLYAGKIGSSNRASVRAGCFVTITNSTIAHSLHWGLIYKEYYNPVLQNNTYFDNLDGNSIGITGW